MLTLFSNVRFGISLGLIDDIEPRVLIALMVETSPAHLAYGRDNPAERDAERARMVRTRIGG